MKNYKGYLIDLDGTMYIGTDEIDGAAQFIDYLNNHQIPHLYVTNNSTKTPEEVTQKLKEMNIDAKPEEVVTSALATIILQMRKVMLRYTCLAAVAYAQL